MHGWRAVTIPKHWLKCITGAKDVSNTTMSHYIQHILNLADKSQICSCHYRLSIALVPVHINLTAISGFAVERLMAGIFIVVVLWDCSPTLVKTEQGRKQIYALSYAFGNFLNLHQKKNKNRYTNLQTLLFAWWSIIPIQLMTKLKNVCPEPFMKKLGKSGPSPDFCLTIH